MITLHFKDGAEMTSQEAAALLRKEGRLGIGHYCDLNGLRCLTGGLENHSIGKEGGWLEQDTVLDLFSKGLDARANDDFVGTPEERCEHFARLFEQL